MEPAQSGQKFGCITGKVMTRPSSILKAVAFAIGLALAQCWVPLVQANESADYVFTNGKVYTVNDEQPWAEAVAVKGNKIVYVGDADGAKDFIGEDTEVIDTGSKIVMPGFVSAHDHLLASAWTNAGVQIYDAKDRADALAKIKAYAESNPDEKVIKGVGSDKNMLGGLPTAKDLDTAVSDRPAIILDNTIHDAWLNMAALKAANITKDSPDTVPGVTY